jgi:glycerate kinase
MFKITTSLNNKVEEFYMVTQEQVDSAIDILDANGYVIVAVSERV